MRAARLLGAFRRRGATSISRIPAQAGLGGAAPTSAAALIGLNRLRGLDLPPCGWRCAPAGRGRPLHADGRTGQVPWRGEDIAPLPFTGGLPLLIIRGGEIPATVAVYRADQMGALRPAGSPDAAEDAFRRSDRATWLRHRQRSGAPACAGPAGRCDSLRSDHRALAARMTAAVMFWLYEASTRLSGHKGWRRGILCRVLTVAEGLVWTWE